MSAPLPERLTTRVILLDDQDRILLMKGRFPNDRAGPGAWFTVGGGAAPGESILETAARELREETGFAAELGPVVWYREGIGRDHTGAKLLFRESYVVARCAGGEPSREAWEAHEHDLIDDIRWWTLDELSASEEAVYPEGLAALLPEIIAGDYPAEPRVLKTIT